MLVALLSRVTGANVHVLTLTLEIVAYAALLWAGQRIASQLSQDRGAVALGVLFTGFGISIFHVGLLAEPFQRAFPGAWLESRVVPLDKFANLSAMPVGYACLGMACAAGIRLAVSDPPWWRPAVVLATCTLVAALVHPLSWLCILPFQAVVGGVLLWARNRADYQRLGALAAALIVPCALALPYLRAVGISESSDGWSGLNRSAELWWDKGYDLAVFVAPLLLLSYVQRAQLWQRVRAGDRALQIVLLAVPTFAAAYLTLRLPGRNEYKFLLALVLPGAALLGLCLRPLIERHMLLAGALLLLLLTPGAHALGFRPWFEVTQPCRTDGPYLRALAPAADEMYQWVARETPADAVFVAANLDIPPLGRRSLYVVLDEPWRGRNGWGLESYKLRQWHVRRPDAVMSSRERAAWEILGPGWEEPAAEILARIQADVANRPVFVQSRDPAVQAKLRQNPNFSLRFQNAAGAIYSALAVSAVAVARPGPDHG